MAEVNLKVPIKLELPDNWVDQVVERLKNDPDSEWVNVTRCKYCKYSHMTYDGLCKYCDNYTDDYGAPIEVYFDGNFYCGFGKRKEDG